MSEAEIKEEYEIIRRAQIDPEVFGFLYEKYYRDIFIFVDRRIDDSQTTADLTSQIFLKALTNLNKYQFKGLPFSSWLFRIAANQVNEFYRHSRFERTVSLDDSHINLLFEDVSAQQNEKIDLVLKLLEQLDQEEVFLLELRFFEERSFKEIAYILDISEGNAKTRTYRILEKLKKIAEQMKLKP
jgi:RNA polymerase sigma-70 factor, ECF subfamily